MEKSRLDRSLVIILTLLAVLVSALPSPQDVNAAPNATLSPTTKAIAMPTLKSRPQEATPTPSLTPGPPSIAWIRQFGTSSFDSTYSGLTVDSSGNAYVAGYTGAFFPGQTFYGQIDAFVRKHDSSGNVLWTRQFATTGDDTANGVGVDSSGNIYVLGQTNGTLPGQTSSGVYTITS